jgi:hypothetical protein
MYTRVVLFKKNIQDTWICEENIVKADISFGTVGCNILST